jgi:hypothetical protein
VVDGVFRQRRSPELFAEALDFEEKTMLNGLTDHGRTFAQVHLSP